MNTRNITLVVFISAVLMPAAELQSTGKARPVTRDLALQPVARYQAGSLFSRDSSLSILWLEDVVEGSTVFEKALTLPDSYRVMISGVAVSFDGTIAAAASATDRHGRASSAIAWLNGDGSLIRVVRTTPFGAHEVSFTADGSLWASGMETKLDPVRKETPVHDVLRRYSPDGMLAGTYLPRLSLSTEWRHPAYHGGLLVTSRERVGFVSDSARQWAVLSADGTILGQGKISAPEGFRIYVGAITDSGRLFVSGSWRGGKPLAYANSPQPAVFEINQGNGELELVDVYPGTFPGGQMGKLVGSEGEELVFHVESATSRQLVWSKVIN